GSRTFLWAVVLNATAAVFGGLHPAPERGLHLLKAWVERSELPEFTAWMLSDMASYLALAGQRDAGLRLAAQGCRLAEQCHPVEWYNRRMDHGRLLLELGLPDEALRVLPESGPEDPTDMLLLAEAHRQAGNRAEASDWLQQATDLIAVRGLDRLR